MIVAIKTILSPPQRAALFDPAVDDTTVERLYTLGTDDLAQVFRRRRASNRLGFAVQLSYLRRPGRPLEPGELPPPTLLRLLAGQIGCQPEAFTEYANRETTLREHRADIEAWLGLRSFQRGDRSAMLSIGLEVAASTDRGEPIVGAMVERLRVSRVVLPAAFTLERVALIARAQARRAAFAGLTGDLSTGQIATLEGLLVAGESGRTGLAWIRDWPEAPSAANLKAVVERLDHVRAFAIEAERARRVHAARYAAIVRVTAIMTAQHLGRLERRRRLAMLVAFTIEAEITLTDSAVHMTEKWLVGCSGGPIGCGASAWSATPAG